MQKRKENKTENRTSAEKKDPASSAAASSTNSRKDNASNISQAGSTKCERPLVKVVVDGKKNAKKVSDDNEVELQCVPGQASSSGAPEE